MKLFHLQALRGLAAMMVVLAHSVDATQGGYYERFAISGYFGVATFFIISGFIIFKTTRTAHRSREGIRQFTIKRLVRIFPIYWLATILFVILTPHRDQFSSVDIGHSLLLIPHYIAFTDGMNPVLGQGWSLHYELLFYLIFAIGLCFSRRTGVILTVAILAVLVAVGLVIRPESDAFGPLTLMQYYTRPIILLFAIGIGLGVLEEVIVVRVRHAFLLMLLLLGGWLVYSVTSSMSEGDHMTFPSLFIIWGLGALLVFISIFGVRNEGWIETVAEAFGDASYSVYLFHAFLLSVLVRLHFQAAHPVLFVAAALIGANIFGYAMFTVIEKPLLSQARRLLLQPKLSYRVRGAVK